jgi:hypothetical protein
VITETAIEYAAKEIRSSLDKIEAAFRTAIKERDTALTEEKVQEIKKYPDAPSLTEWNSFHRKYVPLSKAKSLRLIEEWWAKCLEVAAANDIANPINVRVREKAINTMLSLGLTQRVSVFKSSRSRKREEVTADWYSALLLQIPTGGDISYQQAIKDGLLKAVEDVEQAKLNEQAAAERERQKEIDKRKADLVFVDICTQVGIDPLESGKDSILEALLSKDKYLRLGHYLERNRNDWSDGYYFARTGLKWFEVVSEDDQAIVNEISGLIDSDDVDGRCFRDCHFNYGVLYGMADDSIVALYRKFTEHFPRD